MREQQEVAGLVVALTGGARGIGRRTAGALVAAGARVAIGDLDLPLARQTAAELGPGVLALPLNVTERDSVQAFVDAVERELGPLDVLVNNAGIMPLGRFLQESDETAERIWAVNCRGVLLGMKVALPRMVARGRGHVINIASIAGRAPITSVVTYSGSKHFVVGVSEGANEELKGTGVTVSYVMPAPVKTEMTAGIPTARFVRYIEPEEVAAAIVQTIRTRQVDVFVPRHWRALWLAGVLMPRAGRNALNRALKADIGLATDPASRRAYEERAARSA
jgi:NAD(P)-dependent dehydrogenase (short-subunit alcohol dehydrogenase family)